MPAFVYIIIGIAVCLIVFSILVTAVVFRILLHKPRFSFKYSPMKTNERALFLENYEKSLDWLETVPHKTVWLKTHKLKLCGLLINANSKKTVIIVHGYAAKKEFRLMDAPFYYNMGFNVLLIDNRAHGASDGRWVTMGVKEAEDLKKWAYWIARRYPATQILLDGVSMGSSTVLNASCLQLPSNVKGIVADCGYTSTHDVVLNIFNQYHIPNIAITFWGEFFARCHGFSLKRKNPIISVEKAKLPALFIHGDSDTFVPTYMVDELYKHYAGEKTLIKTPNTGHAASFTIQPEMCQEAVKKFIKKHFDKN